MTSESQTEKDKSQAKNDSETENEKILCPHCKRTATNGIKCKGICVADDDYQGLGNREQEIMNI